MAIYNEILAPRYARLLQKLLGIKGTVPVKQIAGEIMPTLALFLGAEVRFLESWNRFGTAPLQAAVAAQNSSIRLRNPTASKVVAVLEKVTITPGANDLVLWQAGPATVDLASINPAPAQLDGRSENTNSTLVISFTTNAANLVATAGGAAILTTQSYEMLNFENQEIAILPGFAMQFVTTAVNESLRVGLTWRERSLEDSELKA